MLTEAALFTFVATLFSMMNPFGNLAIVAGMTAGRSDDEVRSTAFHCALAVAITLLIVTWGGSAVLSFFGISVDALRAAGGLIVLMIGLNMLSNKSGHAHSASEAEDASQRDSIAVVPLAIPIVAGPGTMVAVLVAGEQSPDVLSKLEISGVIVVMSALCGVLFGLAPKISRALGASGMGVITRVMGMLLVAIAMGLLADGLKALLPGLAS